MNYYSELTLEYEDKLRDIPETEWAKRIEELETKKEFFQQKKEFKEEVLSQMKYQKTQSQTLKQFLEDVIPFKQNPDDEKECYFLFFSDKFGNYCNIKYKTRTEYIYAILAGAKTDYNLFYYPTSFKNGKAKAENAGNFSILFFDIDDIETMPTDEELRQKYGIFDYIIKSGHGIHLYKRIDPQTQREREEALIEWTTYLKADIMNLSACHYIRVPESNNAKPNKEETRGYFVKAKHEKPLPDITISKEEIEKYRNDFFAKRTEKSNQTRIKNGTAKKEKNNATKKKGKRTKDEERYVPITWEYHKKEEFIPGLKYINQNITYEMENMLLRHQGFLECRQRFTFLYTNYGKKIYDKETLKTKIYRLIPKSYKDEAERIIETHYNTPQYHYKFTTIATLLEFDENDYKEAFSPYFNKPYNKTEKTKKHRKKVSQAKKAQKQTIKKVIMDNPQITFNEFQKMGFNICRRTFYNYKKENGH